MTTPLDLMVYVAYPLDFGVADTEITNFAKGWLWGRGISAFTPGEAWSTHAPDARVSSVNNVALAAADAVVAFLPDVKTVGVPAEIATALTRRVPVLIVTDHTRSFVVKGWEEDPLALVVGFDQDLVDKGLDWLVRVSMDQRDVRQVAEKVGVSLPDQKALVFEPVGAESPSHSEGTVSKLPTRGYADDAGFDLYTSQTVDIPAGGFVDVPCGVAVDLPEGVWGFITGRSSTLRKHGLLVSTGIIDTGYTGPLFAGVKNLNKFDYPVAQGDRIAQLIPLPAVSNQLRPVWGKLTEKRRGSQGFGSTGA